MPDKQLPEQGTIPTDQYERNSGKKDFPAIALKWAPLAVLLLTAIIYSSALQNEFTSFDDDFYILKNPFLKDFSIKGVIAIFTSFYTSNYHPLTTLTYLFEYHFFGLNPMPYHLLNVLLHVLNTWLVYKVAARLSGNSLTALIVSALFALHPMHVESVAWVAERKDVLYACFFFSSLLFYLRYLASGYKKKYYIIASLLFLGSLLSKSAAVTLPVVFILVDIYKERGINIKSLAEKIPLLLLSVVFGILNILAQSAGGSINNIAVSFGFINRVFLVTSAIASYFARLVIPYHLTATHYFPVAHNGWLPVVYYLSLPLVILLLWLVIRRSILRKELIFGVSFFFITIVLMLQIISVGSAIISERYTYVSYFGLFYIVGQGVSAIHPGRLRKLSLLVLFFAIAAYTAESWYRIGIWRNDTVLFNDLIEKNPDVYFGYWMRGNFEKRDGDLPSALADYTTCIQLNQKFDDAYYNRGIIYDAMGNSRAAIQDYSASILLNPKLADVYNNRGWAYFKTGDTTAALSDMNTAITMKPTYAEAYNNRGWIYLQSGNPAAALRDFNSAIQADPHFDKPFYNRAFLEKNTGNLSGALSDYTTLLTLRPDDNAIYYYRGTTYIMMRDTSSACYDFQKGAEMGNNAAIKMANEYCHCKY